MGAEPSQKDRKLEGVRMAMGALECPICYEPLVPPIYQCGVGHLVCGLCCIELNKCPLCPRSTFERCFGMEHVVQSIEVPCRFAKNGCTKKLAYHEKKWHEENWCWHGLFCPEPGCGFTGSAAALQDHFTGRHEWPSTAFDYYVQFDLRLRPGPHVLRAQDGRVFLMNVVAAEPPLGHAAVSLVCVRPDTGTSPFGCSLVFSCFTGHHQMSKLDAVSYSSLADGLPKDVFCVVPKASEGAHVVLKVTIDISRQFDIDIGDEDDEVEDESYDDEDDDEENDDSDDEDEEEENDEDVSGEEDDEEEKDASESDDDLVRPIV